MILAVLDHIPNVYFGRQISVRGGQQRWSWAWFKTPVHRSIFPFDRQG